MPNSMSKAAVVVASSAGALAVAIKRAQCNLVRISPYVVYTSDGQV